MTVQSHMCNWFNTKITHPVEYFHTRYTKPSQHPQYCGRYTSPTCIFNVPA